MVCARNPALCREAVDLYQQGYQLRVCRQCLAQGAGNLFPIGMHVAAVQYDGGSALRFGSGADVYAGELVTGGIEHEGFTL